MAIGVDRVNVNSNPILKNDQSDNNNNKVINSNSNNKTNDINSNNKTNDINSNIQINDTNDVRVGIQN